MTQWLVWLNFTSSLSATCSSIETNKRIINGTHARDGAYPWIAHIKYVSEELTSYCGATIISNQWLLTAAHCMWPEKGFENNRSNAAKILHFHLEKIILHPAHAIGKMTQDLT
ncbi:hypothetical protein PHET_04227 [Paragonimus heterotremus]|uniref:Peptidase S1 domain-containing protein n=1 Tax=Paragonimus heterotremus TaxID=100268 RepID=A0A8J4X0R4_9TREM|nr:hypothetical protein PHET_04227 [Paragonimus heterotremus]